MVLVLKLFVEEKPGVTSSVTMPSQQGRT